MPKDIFDLSKTDDLPPAMRQEISRQRRVYKYLPLFERAQRPLSARQVWVAYFRLTGQSTRLRTVRSSLSRYATLGVLKKNGDGTWGLPEAKGKPP